jgi:P4 family phage/plasmid primase-like protien
MTSLQQINEFGTNWFLGKSTDEPLINCLKKASELKHKFICASDYMCEGMTKPTKVYGSYKNSTTFYKNTKNTESEERCFYVIIPENTSCCLFADLEWNLSWKSVDQIKQKFIQVVTDTLKHTDVNLCSEEYLFADACQSTTDKGSLHCHVPCIYFKNIYEQQRFFNAVKLNLDETPEWSFIDESDKSYILKTFIDFGVYNKNRQIRLPYSSKMKNDGIGVRPLIPENEDDFDFRQWTIVDLNECDDDPVNVSEYPTEVTCNKRNLWSKQLVQEVIDNLGLEVTVDMFKGNSLISLKNKRGSRICPINGEENKGDNAYIVIKDNKLHYHCHDEGCKGQSKIIHEFGEDPRIIERKLIDDCIKGSHADCAILFQHMYGHNIQVISKKDKAYYHWNDSSLLWELEPTDTMTGCISVILKTPILKIIEQLLRQLSSIEDNAEKAIATGQLKMAEKLILNLKSTPFLKHIISYYMSFPINKDFETKIINKVPHELPIKNGQVIDLKTLETRKRTRSDYYSVECPVEYRPTADMSSVNDFMNSITCNSTELKDYHRRLWGYMMTGEISDRSLHVFWGNGCNGKSSIVNIIKGIMGDTFVVALSEDVMCTKPKSRGASPEMMDLLHSRCGIMPETDKKEKINSKRVKTITGDDSIKARHLFGHLVQFQTQCKPIWPTNYKPVIDVEDQAIIDRLKLVPFMGRFEKNPQNTKYINDLQTNHLDEFFTWFCTGARDWYAGADLIPCQEMKIEMDKYISECDIVAEFIDDTFDIVTEEEYDLIQKLDKALYRTEKSYVYALFMGWITDNNKKDEVLGKKEFFQSFDKKVTPKKSKNTRMYLCREKGTDNSNHDEPEEIRLM